jgi:hypothetical protein
VPGGTGFVNRVGVVGPVAGSGGGVGRETGRGRQGEEEEWRERKVDSERG